MFSGSDTSPLHSSHPSMQFTCMQTVTLRRALPLDIKDSMNVGERRWQSDDLTAPTRRDGAPYMPDSGATVGIKNAHTNPPPTSGNALYTSCCSPC